MAIVKNTTLTLQKDEVVHHHFTGNYIRIAKSEGKVRLTHDNNNVSLEQGDYIVTDNFTKLTIENSFNGVNIVELVLSDSGKDFGSDSTRITGILETQQKSGSGQLYKTKEINGTAKILNFDADRLFFSIENKSNEVIRLGGVDVSQTYIEIEPNAKYSDNFAPTGEVWVSGTGKASIASKYKTQQAIITPEPLEFNGENLTFNGNNLKLYN